MKPVTVGDVFITNEGFKATVVNYVNKNNVSVVFDDNTGFVGVFRSVNLRSGSVRNPFNRSAKGVGFLGAGPHKTKEGKKFTAAYQTWSDMLKRCYCTKMQIKNPAYIGCSVDERWHNFQTFADWFEINSVKGWCIDKDIINQGNKVYSPESCVFVPAAINNLVLDSRKARGALPIGVSKNNDKYQAQVKVSGKLTSIGTYKTIEEASAEYVKAKLRNVERVIEMYPDVDSRVKKALIERDYSGVIHDIR